MKTRILFVDDSKAVHAFVKDILSEVHFAHLHVFNGQEALNTLATPEAAELEMIVLDWEMPVMSGPETLRKVRESGNKIPVVMMTSKNKQEDIEAMLAAGADDYIMKPFTKDILLEKISSFLGDPL